MRIPIYPKDTEDEVIDTAEQSQGFEMIANDRWRSTREMREVSDIVSDLAEKGQNKIDETTPARILSNDVFDAFQQLESLLRHDNSGGVFRHIVEFDPFTRDGYPAVVICRVGCPLFYQPGFDGSDVNAIRQLVELYGEIGVTGGRRAGSSELEVRDLLCNFRRVGTTAVDIYSLSPGLSLRKSYAKKLKQFNRTNAKCFSHDQLYRLNEGLAYFLDNQVRSISYSQFKVSSYRGNNALHQLNLIIGLINFGKQIGFKRSDFVSAVTDSYQLKMYVGQLLEQLIGVERAHRKVVNLSKLENRLLRVSRAVERNAFFSHYLPGLHEFDGDVTKEESPNTSVPQFCRFLRECAKAMGRDIPRPAEKPLTPKQQLLIGKKK